MVEEFAKLVEIKYKQFLKHLGHHEKQGAKDFISSCQLCHFHEGVSLDIAFEIHEQRLTDFSNTVQVAKRVEAAMQASMKSTNYITENKQTNDICELLMSISMAYAEQIKNLTEKSKRFRTHCMRKN